MGDLIIEKTVSGDTVTFQSRIAAPIKSLKVDIMPIQPGSGNPSTDNVRSISGWTRIQTLLCEKNYNSPNSDGDNIDSSGLHFIFSDNGTRVRIQGTAIQSKKVTPVTADFKGHKYDNYALYGIPILDYEGWSLANDSTLYNDVNGIKNSLLINRYSMLSINIVQGNSYDLDFHPLASDRSPIITSFPASVGTVYGGTLDVISGELISDTIKIAVDGTADWTMLSPGIYSLLGSIDNACVNTKLSKYRSNMYQFRGTGESKSSGLDKDGYFYIQSSVDRIWVYDSNYSTLADFKAFLNENPLEITYPTTAPTVHHLDPNEVKTLLTTNIITSDAGAVTVTYNDKEYTDLIASRRRMLMETPHIERVSGGVASFNTNMAAKLKNLTVEIEPVQAGSGDPSPDNVRAISGWTGCNVTRAVKNLFGGLPFATKLNNLSASSTLDETNKTVTFTRYKSASNDNTLLHCRCNRMTAIVTYSNTSANSSLIWDYADGTKGEIRLNASENKTTVVISSSATAGKSVIRLRLSYQAQGLTTIYYDETGFFDGVVTANDFTPYVATITPITFPVEAGTVYGGTLDVITGLLTVDRGMVTFTNANTGWFLNNNNNGVYYKDFTSTFNAKHNMKLTANYLTSLNSGAGTELTSWQCRYNSANTNLLIKADGIVDASVSAWVEYLTNNPLTLVYELATPTTYQLTPTQVKTLLGNNTIYADTGDVELTYWKH